MLLRAVYIMVNLVSDFDHFRGRSNMYGLLEFEALVIIPRMDEDMSDPGILRGCRLRLSRTTRFIKLNPGISV